MISLDNPYASVDIYEKTPLATAWATFISFVIVGFIPLAPFVFLPFSTILSAHPFIWASTITGLAFVFIGIGKAMITKQNKPWL